MLPLNNPLKAQRAYGDEVGAQLIPSTLSPIKALPLDHSPLQPPVQALRAYSDEVGLQLLAALDDMLLRALDQPAGVHKDDVRPQVGRAARRPFGRGEERGSGQDGRVSADWKGAMGPKGRW